MKQLSLSFFGDEPKPEQLIAVGKSRAKKSFSEDSMVTKKKAGTKEEIKSGILQDWKPQKQYYSIGEVASLFNATTSHIRFWTKEFSLKVRTTQKGDRLFTPVQVYELRAIHHLVKQKGYTLAGAKTKLKEEKRKTVATLSLKQSLLQLRNQLVSIKNQMEIS